MRVNLLSFILLRNSRVARLMNGLLGKYMFFTLQTGGNNG